MDFPALGNKKEKKMERHLLVTVSDELSSLYGARFVRSFFQSKSSMKISLLYVSPMIDPAASNRTGDRIRVDRKTAESYRKRGQQAMDDAKEILAARGYSAELVECKFMHKQHGTVNDIIKESKQGLYDAVVIGRRGFTLLEDFLSHSVSKGILASDVDFPIWVCRMPEEQRRNVLLSVDGSEPSLRIADHVGFMLKDETNHSITMMHVNTGHGGRIDSILEQTRAKLIENGIGEERIGVAVVRSNRIVPTILSEVERKSYAVVAVGRVGVHKSAMKQWLVGSTSMKLVEELDKAVLWVSK